jgi:general secretion pathway protein H
VRYSRGFTLLELMVVIVLAGILMSIVTISVTPDPRQSLAREASRVGQLFTVAADEARIRQLPIYWEADLRGYRFISLQGQERKLIDNDDLLRPRNWERPLAQIAVTRAGEEAPGQLHAAEGAPPVRLAIAREWIQPRLLLDIANDAARVAIDFDERGRGSVARD